MKDADTESLKKQNLEQESFVGMGHIPQGMGMDMLMHMQALAALELLAFDTHKTGTGIA